MAKRFAFPVLSQIPSGIWVLGFVSMLMDISSEMIHSLLPMFMVTVLGANFATVGLIEGVAESTALLTKVFSGFLSDYLGKRKEIVLFGYGLSALTKPLFFLASGIGLVFAARFMDRLGKGIRGAPRDALIADLSPAHIRGASFGLRQSLDTVGAVIGPLSAFLLMAIVADNFRIVFAFALLPAVIAVYLVWVGVRDPEGISHSTASHPFHLVNLKQLSRDYWWVCSIGAMLALARFSEAFLILRAMEGGMSIGRVPLVMVMMNSVYAMTAYPCGQLADHIKQSHLLVASLFVLIASDLVLAHSDQWISILIGVSLWGVHMGLSQGLLAAMVACTSPVTLRGSAYGFYNVLNGIAMIISSTLAGILWDMIGASSTFYAGALFCFAALGVLAVRKPLK